MPDWISDLADAIRADATRPDSNAEMHRRAARFLQDYIPLSDADLANLRLPPGPPPPITSAPIRESLVNTLYDDDYIARIDSVLQSGSLIGQLAGSVSRQTLLEALDLTESLGELEAQRVATERANLIAAHTGMNSPTRMVVDPIRNWTYAAPAWRQAPGPAADQVTPGSVDATSLVAADVVSADRMVRVDVTPHDAPPGSPRIFSEFRLDEVPIRLTLGHSYGHIGALHLADFGPGVPIDSYSEVKPEEQLPPPTRSRVVTQVDAEE